MIANLKTGKFLMLFLLLSANLFGGQTNYYQKIATNYDVHPFEFEYGFPIWFQAPYESNYLIKDPFMPIRGIIYLSNSINYLETYSPTIYIAQPTLENAELIAKLTKYHNGFGCYYLVVDTAIVQDEMTVFIEELAENDVFTEIRFVGKKGNYVPVNYWNVGYERRQWAQAPGMICGLRNQFSVFMNGNSRLLVEGRFTSLSDLDSIVYYNITANLHGERDEEAPLFESVSVNRCKSELSKLKVEQENRNDDKSDLLDYLIQENERKLDILNRFGPIDIMQNRHFEDIRVATRTPLKFYFQVLDQFQKGFFKARQEACMRLSGESYLNAMRKNDLLLLELLTLIYPNRLTVQFGEEEFMRPPRY